MTGMIEIGCQRMAASAALWTTLMLSGAPVTSQDPTVTGTIIVELTSSGASGSMTWPQPTWSASIPVGPLPQPAVLPGMTWSLLPNSLALSVSGVATIPGFTGFPGHFSMAGTVRLDLVAPFETMYEINVTGTDTSVGGYGTTLVDVGSAQTRLGGFFSPVSSVNDTYYLRVGPSGSSITISNSTGGSASSGGFASVSQSLQVSWTRHDAASAASYGAGCTTAAPTMSAASVPQLGSNMVATITSVPGPNPFGLVALGFSDTTSNIGSLPMDLSSFGMTSCFLLQSAEITGVAAAASPSSLDFSLALPNDPLLIAVNVFTQAFCYAPGANPLDAVISNGVRWQIGS